MSENREETIATWRWPLLKPGFSRLRSWRFILALTMIAALTGSCAWPQTPRLSPGPDGPNAPSPAKGTPELAGGPESGQRPVYYLASPPPAEVVRAGNPGVKWVALTFDDGPDTHFTPMVLDVLKRHGVKATFYLTGHRAEAHPEVVRRIAREGHEVGNHTYNHPNLVKLPPWKVREQMARTHQILRRITLKPVRTFRPPYGAFNPQIMVDARALGYRTIHWSVDSLDWKSLPRDQVLANILPNVRPGSIILQHSAGGIGEDLTGTVQALAPLIRTLSQRGYRFVTISEMLGIAK